MRKWRNARPPSISSAAATRNSSTSTNRSIASAAAPAPDWETAGSMRERPTSGTTTDARNTNTRNTAAITPTPPMVMIDFDAISAIRTPGRVLCAR